MYGAKSIAATALRHQQIRIDTIANNVANTNTVSFKSARLDFKDALYTTGLVPGPARSPDENHQKGHGVMIAGIGREFGRPGAFERTEQPLDLAIEGEGFFTLQNPDGGVLFTRNGRFSLSVEAEGTFIVNGQGYYLLDGNGNRIVAPFGTTSIEAGTNGVIRFMQGDIMLGAAELQIVTFRNLFGLAAVGSANFEHTESAGEILPAGNSIVRQGVLEMSNVSLAEEMTRLIRTQRAFQLASRALTTADEMEGVANNMRR